MTETLDRVASAGEPPAAHRPSLRSFWHPVARSSDVTDAPRGMRLLEEDVVVFRDPAGAVYAWRDICVHRGTRLSLGRLEGERLVCAYHGWEFGPDGRCVHIPSLGEGGTIPSRARATTYLAQDADGLVWVALEQPLVPLPPLVPPGEEGWRTLVVSGGETWLASAGRVAENSIDVTHVPFVHPGLLFDDPIAPHMEITESSVGFVAAWPGEAVANGETLSVTWSMHVQIPFLNDIWWHHPSGLGYGARVVACPVSPKESRVFVVNVRNHDLGSENDERFIAFSNTVIHQDQAVVESQRPEELPLRLRDELHLKVPDALAVIYRRRLSEIEAGDVERYRLAD